MNKRISKLLALTLSLLLIISLFSACASNNNNNNESNNQNAQEQNNENDNNQESQNNESNGNKIDNTNEKLEEVTLTFYFPDQKKPMFDDVWDEIAVKTKPTLNANFEITFVGWNDYADKIRLLSAAGDKFDGYFDANWNMYNQMVTKGALYDVSQILPEYAPNYYAKLVELDFVNPCMVGDKMFALPWTVGKAMRPYFIYREDIAEKYDIDTSGMETLEDLEVYLEAVKENEPSIQPTWWAQNSGTSAMVGVYFALMAKYELDMVTSGIVYDLNDPNCQLIPFEQTQAFEEGANIIKRWFDKGYISKNMISFEQKDHFKAGTSASFFHQLDSAVSVMSIDGAPDGKNAGIKLYPDKKYGLDSPLGNVFAINKYAANPKRTVMFIELLSTDRDVYDMVMYGIENETYVLDEEKVRYPEGMDATSSVYLDWVGQWCFWRSKFIRPTDTQPASYWEANEESLKDPTNVMASLVAFSPDLESLKTEVAKRETVAGELFTALVFGLQEDTEKAVTEYIEAQENAGTQKIVDELQKQVDEFLKEN